MSSNLYKNASPAYKKRLRKYYLLVLLSEGSKILAFFLFFAMIGMAKEFWICLLFMLPLRTTGGGLHVKTYTGCFLVSFTVISLNLFLSCLWYPGRWIKALTLLLCMVTAFRLVPITSDKRPPATPDQVRHSKQNTVIILTICLILMCALPGNPYINIGYWTIIINTAQLVIARGMKEVKKV